MALYETVIIARQDLTAENVDALVEKLSKIVTDKEGKVVSKEYWGLRDLAYKINKNSRGHYFLLNIDATKEAINELNRVISFNEDVVRTLTFATAEHKKETALFASKSAKDFKPNKSKEKKEPSKIDLALQKVQFEV